MEKTEKTIRALADMITYQQDAMNQLVTRMNSLESNLTVLYAEVANSKQLTGHLLGKGLGSTVSET